METRLLVKAFSHCSFTAYFTIFAGNNAIQQGTSTVCRKDKYTTVLSYCKYMSK